MRSSLQRLKKTSKKATIRAFRQGLTGDGAVILVSNSFTKIKNFADNALDLIELALTYDDEEVILQLKQAKIQLGLALRYRNFKKVTFFKHQIQELTEKQKVCWFKNGSFPTGHLKIVSDVLHENKIPFKINDLRDIPHPSSSIRLKKPLPELRYYQKEVLDIAIKEHRGVIESAVGSGKSLMMQAIIHSLKTPSLVVVPSKDLAIQLYDSFVEYFGSLGVELVNTGKKNFSNKPIKITSIHTLISLKNKNCLEPLLKNIDLIAIDEIHHAGAKSYNELLPYFDHIYYRFGFSGTFMRNDSKTLDMGGFLSTVLYRYSASKATAEGFLTPLSVNLHTIQGIRKTKYHTEYTENYCENDNLLECIERIVLENSGNQILVLVGRKEKSGKVIHEHLNKLTIPNQFVSGDDKKDVVKQALSNFNDKKIRVLIGSTIIGEGIDIRSTDRLIMAQGGKSEIAVTQALGRAARLYPGKSHAYVHDFIFENTKYLEKHLEKRLKIYEKNFAAKVLKNV